MQGMSFLPRQMLWTGVPGRAPMSVAGHIEEDEILKPIDVLALELFKGRVLGTLLAGKVSGGLPQQRHLGGDHLVEQHRAVESPAGEWSARRQPSFFGETFQTDEQRVAGECRNRGVGRAAESRRRERKDLP